MEYQSPLLPVFAGQCHVPCFHISVELCQYSSHLLNQPVFPGQHHSNFLIFYCSMKCNNDVELTFIDSHLQCFSVECCKTQNKEITQQTQWTNQTSKLIHVTSVKRAKEVRESEWLAKPKQAQVPLSPNSGENEISLYIITTCSNT